MNLCMDRGNIFYLSPRDPDFPPAASLTPNKAVSSSVPPFVDFVDELGTGVKRGVKGSTGPSLYHLQ